MLFNSLVFIFAFLPLTACVYFLLTSRRHIRPAVAWLVLASWFFYAWWDASYLALLLGSMAFNFALGSRLSFMEPGPRRAALRLGVAANLGLLGYYKYSGFFVDTLAGISGLSFQNFEVALPLAISFFTFQQIAYLVDASRGETQEHSFFDYALFVSFFPQLIAGPIVHHGEMLPQFSRLEALRPSARNVSIGLTIFVIGLSKKVLLADTFSTFASPVFATADSGVAVSLLEAWTGALAYTFQLYFDFSGYSDMAIGAARIFGITLPINFDSPYKSTSAIEFWRRWHMTLSRFLRDYLYIPLGGNRRGRFRRYVNLFLTMLLGGLWHGAGVTFVVWGALHGIFLIVNHVWRALPWYRPPGKLGRLSGLLLTFTAVVAAWVVFRAPSMPTALNMLSGMLGLNGVVLPLSLESRLGELAITLKSLGIGFGWTNIRRAVPWLAAGFAAVWLLPNTQEFMARYEPVLKSSWQRNLRGLRWAWSPGTAWGVALGLVFVVAVSALLATAESEFLYFDF